MTVKRKFQGAGVAIATPFLNNDEIDYTSLAKQVKHVIAGKIDYIVLFGTTGESPTISYEEKKVAVRNVSEMIAGRVPLVVGFGGNNTGELVSQITSFDFQGVDAMLSVCPYYNKPNQNGMYYHFKAVCDASPVPVILYNVPGRTVVNMEPDTTIRIAQECPNVIGIKEATDNLDQVMDLLHRKPENLLVIAGDDALALPFMSLGADGAISVIANAFPGEFAGIIHAAEDGNYVRSRQYHFKLLPLMQILLKSGNPSGIKAILSCMGLCGNHFRLPVHQVTEEQYQALCSMTRQIMDSTIK